MPPKPRGSEKLAASRRISEKNLDRIVALTRARGVKVIDWHVLGQPAPDAIQGTFQVGAGRVSGLVEEVLKLRDLRPRFDIFPYGIPKPDIFNVRVRF